MNKSKKKKNAHKFDCFHLKSILKYTISFSYGWQNLLMCSTWKSFK